MDRKYHKMFWDDMAVIDWVILKGRYVSICKTLQRQALEQFHVNHMGIQKAKLLACESAYWTGMNDIENDIKYCSTCLDFQQMQPKETKYPPRSPRQTMGSSWDRHVYPTPYKLPLYSKIITYHSMFPVIKQNWKVISRKPNTNMQNQFFR